MPPAAVLSSVPAPVVPPFTGELPEDDTHLIKARLLANAALNEYIGPEILASPTSSQWGALAQAEIYVSYGETTRALQSMKHSGMSFFAMPRDQVPRSTGICSFRSRTGPIWLRTRRAMDWIRIWWPR